MTTINDLPDDILGDILDYCPKNNHSTLWLENVCKKWRTVVDKYQGVFMVTGKGENNISISEVKGNSRVLVLTNYSDSAVLLKEENDTTVTPTNETPNGHGDVITPSQGVLDVAQIQQKLGCPNDYVRKLSFVGKMQIQVPSMLINMCKNLTGLHFHISSLIGVHPSLPLVMDIPTLQSFVIDSYGMKEHWKVFQLESPIPGAFVNMEEIFSTTIALMNQNKFPHLQTFIVDLPFCEEKEKAVFTGISSFLEKHYESIQNFCYHQGFRVKIPKKTSTEEEEDDENEVSLAYLAQSAAKLKKVSLKQLHIGLYQAQESDPLWINFLIQQCNLDKVIFTGDFIPFPAITIQVNHNTLTTVVMEVRDNVDIMNLKDCHQLRKLTLLGMSEVENEDESELEEEVDDDDNRNTNILNLTQLPTSVENLRINMLKVEGKAVTQVICSGAWKHLKELELIDCGIEGNNGVPLQAIGYIWENRTLNSFQIDYSLNRKSTRDRKHLLPPAIRLLAYCLNFNSVSNFRIKGKLSVGGTHYEVEEKNMKTILGIGEIDLFQFPEEIYPTGYHRKFDSDHDKEESEVERDSDRGSNSGSSSYEDMDEDEEGGDVDTDDTN